MGSIQDGIPVLCPDETRDKKNILIAVKNHEMEILEQLSEFDNVKIILLSNLLFGN